jgi:hypothetical protein
MVAAGDFDDWNPRGEVGTGGDPGQPTLGNTIVGACTYPPSRFTVSSSHLSLRHGREGGW